MDFRGYIRTKILKKSDRILEFGPLIRPLVSKKDFPNVYFADVRSTEQIKELYTANHYLEATGLSVDIEEVAPIDYVITKSYTNTFQKEEKFDVVYLSHVIEHMPDIISFLKDVVNILKKNGKLVLIYPDARYCFDHFRNGSTFIDAYETYTSKSMNSRAVFDFTFNVAHENDPSFFWNSNKVMDRLPANDFRSALTASKDALANKLPEDVHFWPFSDYQFIKFLYDVDRAGLLDFDIAEFHQTRHNTQEFMIVLTPKKRKKLEYKKYQKLLTSISPTVKSIQAANEKQDLLDHIQFLESTLKDVQKELSSVYNSKRWKLSSKISNLARPKLGLKK